jgi:hypothetical protein
VDIVSPGTGRCPEKPGKRSPYRAYLRRDGRSRRMPDGFGIQLYIHTRAVRITAESMPAREGLYAGMSRAFPHRYNMSGFLAAKARATLQDGNPEPGPELYRYPGQRWDEGVFAALLKTEWWMCWKGGWGKQRCLPPPLAPPVRNAGHAGCDR